MAEWYVLDRIFSGCWEDDREIYACVKHTTGHVRKEGLTTRATPMHMYVSLVKRCHAHYNYKYLYERYDSFSTRKPNEVLNSSIGLSWKAIFGRDFIPMPGCSLVCFSGIWGEIAIVESVLLLVVTTCNHVSIFMCMQEFPGKES